MRLPERLRHRLDALEREAPDGALAGYLWLWRTLERTSASPGWWLRLRFIGLVSCDVALLLAWVALRPILRLVARRPLAAATVASLLLLGAASLLSPSHDGGSGEPPPMGSSMPHVRIDVLEVELVRFQGQVVRLEELPSLLRHYDVRTAGVTVEHDATYRLVDRVAGMLAEQGVSRVTLRMGDPPPERPRR